MELVIEKYKREWISLSLILFFWINGAVCSAYGLELTSFLFVLFAVCSIVYLLVFFLLYRKKDRAFIASKAKMEISVVLVLLAILCIVGISEAHPKLPPFSAVFTLLLIYVIIFSVVMIINQYRLKKGAAPMSKSVIKKIAFWAFVIGIGRVLILIEEYGDDDALFIVAFIYFPVIFFLAARWIFKQTKAIISLKHEKAKTELQHLKSQVNPHFFFNTLNNLYGLVGNDTKKAQELILKLSDMMRYSIYEGDKEYVTLAEEVTYLNQYIDLHSMRYRKAIDVTFDVDVQDHIKVMPLLFLILLENAFKHGVENLRTDAYVHASLKTVDGDIVFEIENNFDPEINEAPGIGLENLKRRLELGYPKSHSLVLDVNDNVYKAQLTLKP
jgi:hypothetical protein